MLMLSSSRTVLLLLTGENVKVRVTRDVLLTKKKFSLTNRHTFFPSPQNTPLSLSLSLTKTDVVVIEVVAKK